MALSDGKTLGIALSGGGYRATLFGLGSLWRLNDAGLLGRLDRITSVSGGSILAGILALAWSKLRFDHDRADNFVALVAQPVQKFCSKTIDVRAGLAGLLTPGKSAGDYLIQCYAKTLFGKTRISDLPIADGKNNPRFIFYATNMQTGRSFRFRQDMMADYLLGICRDPDVPLATAVAASSAFPPIFSPIILHTHPTDWVEGAPIAEREALQKRIVLADGGIYDNMGLESVDIVLVSDAGAPFDIETEPHSDYLHQLGRVRDILIDQTRALRKRWLITEFESGRKRGAYWGVSTRIADYGALPKMARDTPLSSDLKQAPTRLSGFSPELQGHLINWGYALCDTALRARAALKIPMATEWPIPSYPL